MALEAERASRAREAAAVEQGTAAIRQGEQMRLDAALIEERCRSLEAEAAAAKKACEEAVAAADAATRGEAEQITQ